MRGGAGLNYLLNEQSNPVCPDSNEGLQKEALLEMIVLVLIIERDVKVASLKIVLTAL